jgi:hypothetical protein
MAFSFVFINSFSRKGALNKECDVKNQKFCLQRRPREAKYFVYFPWPPLEAGLKI